MSRRQVGRWDARSLIHLLHAAPRSGIVHIQFQAGAYDLLGDVCLMPALLRRLRPKARSVTTFHDVRVPRSEEHTSELQSHLNLVCRLLLEKKKKKQKRSFN